MKKLLILLLLTFGSLQAQNLDTVPDSNVTLYDRNTAYTFSGVDVTIGLRYLITDTTYTSVNSCNIEINHFERKEAAITENIVPNFIPDPIFTDYVYYNYTFQLPRTGHYTVDVTCCTTSSCSPTISSVNDSDVFSKKGWWLFAWIAPPEF